MNLWNVKYLEAPPSTSCKLLNQEINLHELNGLITDALNLFSSQIFLDAEYKVLHSFVRNNKLSLRTFVGFKMLQKLNRCARNFQEADYKSLIQWFRSYIPSRFETDTYFPSRNVLDYFLVRTQGVAKLITRLLEVCKDVHKHWIDRLKMGHSFGYGILVIAIMSRMFIIFRYLLQCICHLYDSLMAMRDKVPNIKYNWLPSDYKLPRMLQPWLDIDWAFREEVFDLRGKNRDLFSISIFDDDDIGDVEFTKEYRIVHRSDAADLQFINEYMNILDSDEERPMKVDEIDDDLQLVHDGLKSMICKVKGASVINLDDEIGEPVVLSSKVDEVRWKLDDIRSLDGVEKFLKDGSHEYFRSSNKLANQRYKHLLSVIELHRNTEGSKKERKKLLSEVKEKVIEIVQTK